MLEALTQTKYWMIDADFAVKWQEIIQHRLRNGKDLPVFSANNAENEKLFSAKQANMVWDDEKGFSYWQTEAGNVARIPLKGTMTYDGGLCSYGTKEIANMINLVNGSDELIGAVLVIDTPGGDGASVEVLQNAINNSAKPIVGWVEQTMASAGVWSTAPADFIMASSGRFNTIGSIGGYRMYQNIAGALENEGVEVKIIRAPQSTNKVTVNAIEPLTEALEAEMVSELKDFVDYFIADVKNYRGVEDDGAVFTGKTYSGQEALDLGLVDAIGTLEEAIQVVTDMAVIKTSPAFGKAAATRNELLKADIDMKFSEVLNKIFGGEATQDITLSERLAEVLGMEEQEIKVSAEAAEAFAGLEAMITGYESLIMFKDEQLAEKDNEIATLDKEVLELGNENTAFDNRIADLEAENEALRKAPAKNHTSVDTAADVVTGDDKQVKALTGYKLAEAQARRMAEQRAKRETQTQE